MRDFPNERRKYLD
ncbi:unnamed protein product, partial [Vitis vinifera]|uniref:Uncharacterized protein n=1 Tax=Vitis vinifera TaxID=29760 RepID=D7SJZ2_VITVI